MPESFTPFNYEVESYDFHTYIPLAEPAKALEFRQALLTEFKDELETGAIRAYEPWLKEIGPHADGWGMFELDCRDSAKFLKLLNYYQLNHNELSVLIHPRTQRGDVWDHTIGAFWLGEKLPLKLDKLAD